MAAASRRRPFPRRPAAEKKAPPFSRWFLGFRFEIYLEIGDWKFSDQSGWPRRISTIQFPAFTRTYFAKTKNFRHTKFITAEATTEAAVPVQFGADQMRMSTSVARSPQPAETIATTVNQKNS